MRIKDVKAIEILDSRGNPTVRSFVTLDDGTIASSSVPSGASTGSHEAVELRDGDTKRFYGKGVLKAINHVNETIKKSVLDEEADPKTIDEKMIGIDGTVNKSRLGANAILSISQALIRALAFSKKIPLWQFINKYYFQDRAAPPKIMFNVVNGGRHADWNLDIQEFMIVPSYQLASESIKCASEIYHNIKKVLKGKKLSILVGDEGGFSPNLNNNEEVFQLIIEAAKQAGYENGKDYRLAIDAAASEFYQGGKYLFKKEDRSLTGKELIDYYEILKKKYKVFSFEDPFAESDWTNFKKFTAVDPNFVVIGDDIYTTDPKLIKKGVKEKTTNAVLIKPNQIGTILETVEAIMTARSAGWRIAISHRSGETEDPFIADLAYACGADFLKTCAPCRSDRTSKYNRLIEIENGL